MVAIIGMRVAQERPRLVADLEAARAAHPSASGRPRGEDVPLDRWMREVYDATADVAWAQAKALSSTEDAAREALVEAYVDAYRVHTSPESSPRDHASAYRLVLPCLHRACKRIAAAASGPAPTIA